VDYLNLIRILCKGDVLRLADDIKLLKEKHHGFIGGDHLFLRGQKLIEEILKFSPKASYKLVSDNLIA
jgi:hypothetical protein